MTSNAQTVESNLSNADQIDRYLAEQIRSTKIPGLVALVVNKDGELYSAAFGHRDVANQAPMTMDTIFRIASMTKPLAATAVMMLVEDGQLDLDDPIADYIPAYSEPRVLVDFNAQTSKYTTRPSATPITIRHLLSHSSGMAYGFSNHINGAIRQANPELDQQTLPLLYDPGTSWSYGQGISQAGIALEHITGMGLERFLQERLFQPLGMSETSYIVSRANQPRVTTLHRLDDSGLIEIPNPIDIRSSANGDRGLHSTARDYAKFIQLFLNDGVAPNGQRLLSSKTIEEMSRNQLGPVRISLQQGIQPDWSRPFPLGADHDSFGLGFQITGPHSADNQRAPGSLSWAGLLNTQFWIDRENGIGGILLMQYLPFYDEDAIKTLQGFEALVYRGLGD
ncbi:MAG: serine hydrolase domain-containing protein [Pseudomonadota bacterium]